MPSSHLLARRAQSIQNSATVHMADTAAALRAQGAKVIDLSAGRAAEATSKEICAAASNALHQGDTHQTPARGAPHYLEAVASKLAIRNGIDASPEREVMATLGCKNALTLALGAILDDGDEVIIEAPCFVSYAPTIRLFGGHPVVVPLARDAAYRWDQQSLRQAVTSRTKAIVFCSPHNPVGVVHTAADLDAIASVAREFDLLVLADEIYEAVTWEARRHIPMATRPGMRQRTLGMMGLTKSHAMGGWRCGYAYGPDWLIDKMTTLQAHLLTCASAIAQRAGVEALSEDTISRLADTLWPEWERRCRDTTSRIDAIEGLSCDMPQGGFYGWMNIADTGLDSTTFSHRLLAEHQVSTVPGASFAEEFDDFVRVTCVKSTEDLQIGIDRLEKFAESL